MNQVLTQKTVIVNNTITELAKNLCFSSRYIFRRIQCSQADASRFDYFLRKDISPNLLHRLYTDKPGFISPSIE